MAELQDVPWASIPPRRSYTEPCDRKWWVPNGSLPPEAGDSEDREGWGCQSLFLVEVLFAGSKNPYSQGFCRGLEAEQPRASTWEQGSYPPLQKWLCMRSSRSAVTSSGCSQTWWRCQAKTTLLQPCRAWVHRTLQPSGTPQPTPKVMGPLHQQVMGQSWSMAAPHHWP